MDLGELFNKWPELRDSPGNNSTQVHQSGAAGTEHAVCPLWLCFLGIFSFFFFSKQVMNIFYCIMRRLILWITDPSGKWKRDREVEGMMKSKELHSVRPWVLKSPNFSWMLENQVPFGKFRNYLAVLSILFSVSAWGFQCSVSHSASSPSLLCLARMFLGGSVWRINIFRLHTLGSTSVLKSLLCDFMETFTDQSWDAEGSVQESGWQRLAHGHIGADWLVSMII